MASDDFKVWQPLGTKPIIDAENGQTRTLQYLDGGAAPGSGRGYRIEATLP